MNRLLLNNEVFGSWPNKSEYIKGSYENLEKEFYLEGFIVERQRMRQKQFLSRKFLKLT